VGTVIKIGDGIAGNPWVGKSHGRRTPGVSSGRPRSGSEFGRGQGGGPVLFGDFQVIREGDLVKRTGRIHAGSGG